MFNNNYNNYPVLVHTNIYPCILMCGVWFLVRVRVVRTGTEISKALRIPFLFGVGFAIQVASQNYQKIKNMHEYTKYAFSKTPKTTFLGISDDFKHF